MTKLPTEESTDAPRQNSNGNRDKILACIVKNDFTAGLALGGLLDSGAELDPEYLKKELELGYSPHSSVIVALFARGCLTGVSHEFILCQLIAYLNFMKWCRVDAPAHLGLALEEIKKIQARFEATSWDEKSEITQEESEAIYQCGDEDLIEKDPAVRIEVLRKSCWAALELIMSQDVSPKEMVVKKESPEGDSSFAPRSDGMELQGVDFGADDLETGAAGVLLPKIFHPIYEAWLAALRAA